MTQEKKYKAWVISDGRAGRRNQCIGVAQKLPADIEILKLSEIELQGGITQYLTQRLGHPPQKEDWPDVVLSSGDAAGNAAIEIKNLSGKTVFIAAITTPARSVNFNFVATTKHTKVRTAYHNVEMIGVPHKVTPEFIKKGVDEWRERMQGITEHNKPILSVLIGGDINDEFKFDINEAMTLGDNINAGAKKLNAALLITNSPRMTVPVWRAFLTHALDGIEVAYVHDCRATEGNPYSAMIGLADVIAVTGDSISMCCEAADSGKPTYIMTPPSITPPLYSEIHGDLYDLGLARKFEEDFKPYEVKSPPMDEAGRVAKELSAQLDEHLSKQKTL